MAIAIAVSIWERVDLERDIAVAVARSFIQLSAVGLVINVIFEQDRIVFVIALIAAMVLFGALTARNRARQVPGAFWPLLVALALAGAPTLVLVVVLGRVRARAALPRAGRRHGDRQRDDGGRRLAQPARRRR